MDKPKIVQLRASEIPRATPLVSDPPVLRPRPEKTWTRPETVPMRPINGAIPVTTSSTINPRSSRTSSRRARVWTDSMFSARGQRRCCNAVRTTPASEELSSFTIRTSRSALPPGMSRSISLSITRGRTLRSRKVSAAITIVATVTIEQNRSGHMNKPPLFMKFNIVCNISVISEARIPTPLVRVRDKRQLRLQTFARQRAGHVFRNRRQLQFLDRLQADAGEGFIRAVFDQPQICHSPRAIDGKRQSRRANADQ